MKATNTYEKQAAQVGGFSITKKISGAQDVTRSFTFTYSTSTGAHGEVVLKADQTWTSESYPVGTVVTIREVGSPTIAGHEFAGVTFTGNGIAESQDGSSAQLTISDSSTVEVTATNTYTEEGLAHTGFDGDALLAGTVVALLLGGTMLAFSSRRRLN